MQCVDPSCVRTFFSRSFQDPSVAVVPRTVVPFEVPTIVTGGATGVDTLAETLAHRHGYRVKVFLPPYRTSSSHPSSIIAHMTPAMQNEGSQKIREANTTLQRNLRQTTLQWGLLQRNFWIIKDVERVIAFGHSEESNIPNCMKGGTGWSVQLAIDHKKPLVVFKDDVWYKYDYSMNTFQPSTRPRVHPISTAIVGTRQMTPSIIQELKLVLTPTNTLHQLLQ